MIIGNDDTVLASTITPEPALCWRFAVLAVGIADRDIKKRLKKGRSRAGCMLAGWKSCSYIHHRRIDLFNIGANEGSFRHRCPLVVKRRGPKLSGK